LAYAHADKNIQTGFSDRVFDSQKQFLRPAPVRADGRKQPKEGFGGLVNLTVGSDAQVIHSFPEFTSSTTGSMFDVTQAYMQYATGPLTVIAGKFTTCTVPK